MIIDDGAEIISEVPPSLMDLAYEIRHSERSPEGIFERYNEAYFSSIKFKLSKDKVKEIDEKLKNNPEILRFIFVKTPAEDTRFEKPVEELAQESSKIKVDNKKLDQIAQDEGMDMTKDITNEDMSDKDVVKPKK